MKLHYHPASTTSRIVMLYAAEAKHDLEYVLVDLFAGEHLQPPFGAINPSRLVPVLEDDDFRLSESSAIVKYLADKAGSPAYPQDLRMRARINERMDWFNANFYRDFGYGLVYPQVFPHHRRATPEVQEGTLAWARERARAWLAILDQSLLGPHGRYLAGDTVTLADYLGVEMLAAGELIGCRFAAWPNVERWLGRMKELKSWRPVHEVFDGFVRKLSETKFVTV